jgi:lipoprotein-anchoring transpeptidase ErfK/SrfK
VAVHLTTAPPSLCARPFLIALFPPNPFRKHVVLRMGTCRAVMIRIVVIGIGLAGFVGAAAAQSYPPPPGGYYPAPPPGTYYPPPPGYYPPPNPYTPAPPRRYSDAPLPPLGVGADPNADGPYDDRDVTGGPLSPYDPAREEQNGEAYPNAYPPAGQPSFAPPPRPGATAINALPPDDRPEQGPAKEVPPQFHRLLVDFPTTEPAGTVIIDTPHTYLYLVRGGGKAVRYGIGVGREGFTWSGTERISRMTEWPDWHPPKEMIERQPYLPRFMAGGDGNPLGARALYLGNTLYRIHGTNQPSTIGHFVSSGCIRLTNEDIEDLYSRVNLGTRVVVLPRSAAASAQGTLAR